MKTGQLIQNVVLVTALATAVGCAGQSPVSTTASNDQANAPQRQVMSAPDVKVDPKLEADIKALPKQISYADADKMLVTIDPDKIKDNDGKYTVQWRGRYGGFRGYGAYRYYGYGGRYYPYYGYGGFYRPYFYGGYYPYLYGAGLGLYSSYYYNPYLYTGLGLNYLYPYAYRWPRVWY